MTAHSSPGGEQTRVFLHIGAPKTGTTYLQFVLLRNRERLAKAGVLYPYEKGEDTFRMAHDFCGDAWFGHGADRFSGEWERVARLARTWTGSTVIISSELLAAASPERIRNRLALLEGTEVHVVFSARDFARQLVSDWQEQIKHKHTVTLERFVTDLVERGLDAPEPFGRLFWGMHDAAYVLDRWSAVVPPSRIHVITVPPPGSPQDVLWRRFCAVTGLDPDRYQTSAKRSNPSMGVVETELVRRMNRGVKKMDGNSYDVLVRLYLAEKVLDGGTPRLTLPPKHLPWVRERSQALVATLNAAGYQVEGDLDDLIPAPAESEYVSPTALTDADLGPAALAAATALLKQAGKVREQNRKLKVAAQDTTSWTTGLSSRIGAQGRRILARLRPHHDLT